MIREVTGDILLSKAHAIAHGIAPDDDFHTGLALTLREHAPALYEDFRHDCRATHPRSGGLWTWMGPDGRYVINLFTQAPAEGRHGGHPGAATLPNVRHALEALRGVVQSESIRSLALPRLANGVGRLDWEAVRPLIDECLGDLSIPVLVYSLYQPGVPADEGL